MIKQIWTGPVLGKNRTRLIERCAELISNGQPDAFIYLAASQPLMELVTTALLDGERTPGVWGSLPVHLFRGFVQRILDNAIDEETGLPTPRRITIDREDFPLKRSLLAQIVRRLASADRLKSFGPLARGEGCVNSIASLIGEIQRAAKTPDEFAAVVEARARDFGEDAKQEESLAAAPRQVDFDREMALIYSTYSAVLEQFRLTEDDADQLRALSVLRGEVNGKQVKLPWLNGVRLLVLDGFFDFTPVQGEMLRLLIPQVPEVIVNFNRDERNPEIFRPYEPTIGQLCSMAEFEIYPTYDEYPVADSLSSLRERLFNPEMTESPVLDSIDQEHDKTAAAEVKDSQSGEAIRETSQAEPAAAGSDIRLLECSDRETELRSIAKEIKRLVFIEDYKLAEIALVVRERTSYSDAIARIFADEGIPCNIERQVSLNEIPSVRATLKLFRLLRDVADSRQGTAKIGDLADLLKSEYFRPSESDIAALRAKFERERTFRGNGPRMSAVWDVDELENVVAFVGGDLRISDWLGRAQRLTGRAPKQADAYADSIDEEPEAEGLVSLDAESESAVEIQLEIEQAGSEVKPKMAREVPPDLIAWVAMLIDHIAGLIGKTLLDGSPSELRHSVLLLMERLQFAGQFKVRSLSSETELPRATLDLRGLEAIRRAFVAAIRSIEITEKSDEGSVDLRIRLTTLIEEVTRCLRSQVMRLRDGDRDGLQVLEATDVRGLRFRAIFITGLNEGGFPLRAPRDWIYPPEERERLKEYGLTLEDISSDTLLKEEHYFYQAACRATDRLYLSRPLLLEGDIETVASYYIQEVRHAIAPFEISSEVIGRDFNGRDLFAASTSSELMTSLVRQSERRRRRIRQAGQDLLPLVYVEGIISWAEQNQFVSRSALDRINIERQRAGKEFTGFDGEISQLGLVEALYEQFGGRHVFSASELSLYGKCPFKFYAERLLRLEPRGEAAIDLKALDAGRLLHDALRRFFERRRSQQLTSVDRETLRAELQQVADEVFDEYEREIPPLNPQVWRIDREIRKVLLDQVLIYELRVEEEAKGMRPTYFELGFGMEDGEGDPNSTPEYLQYSRTGVSGEREDVAIRGRIDRVDVAEDGTVIAYDYKLSRGATLDDMREGRDLQIGIYLAALELLFLRNKEIAGGGYYVLRGKQDRRNRGLYRQRFVEYTKLGGNVAANLSDEEWAEVRQEMNKRVWEFIEGMQKGRFIVKPSAPKDTCPRCDYSTVCRYERFRIIGKK